MASDLTALEIKDLKTYFFFDEGIVHAVDGVSLTLDHGKTLGVVGSSAIRMVGLQARAMAIMARWRMPPESSNG